MDCAARSSILQAKKLLMAVQEVAFCSVIRYF